MEKRIFTSDYIEKVKKSTTLLAVMGVISSHKKKYENDECAICLENEDEPEYIKIEGTDYTFPFLPFKLKQCGHIFHEHCLYQSFCVRHDDCCPICRQPAFPK